MQQLFVSHNKCFSRSKTWHAVTLSIENCLFAESRPGKLVFVFTLNQVWSMWSTKRLWAVYHLHNVIINLWDFGTSKYSIFRVQWDFQHRFRCEKRFASCVYAIKRLTDFFIRFWTSWSTFILHSTYTSKCYLVFFPHDFIFLHFVRTQEN